MTMHVRHRRAQHTALEFIQTQGHQETPGRKIHTGGISARTAASKHYKSVLTEPAWDTLKAWAASMAAAIGDFIASQPKL